MIAMSHINTGEKKNGRGWKRGVKPFRPRGLSAFTLLSGLLLLLPGLVGCTNAPADSVKRTAAAEPQPERIISTAPSITEIVFALGAGDKLAGVTKFCKYPSAAQSIPKVGGLLDPSGEAVIRLDPDLVIILEENLNFRKELTGEGYKVLAVDHKNIPGIINSFQAIGSACGREEAGNRLASELRQRLADRQGNAEPETGRPKVLISVGRNAGSGNLGKVVIAGQDDYYDAMIRMAGGVNAYSGKIRYPAISVEGLLRMNTAVIFDLFPGYKQQGLKQDSLLKEWNEMRGTRAFEAGDIYVKGEDFWTLPGPRFINIIESLEKILITD